MNTAQAAEMLGVTRQRVHSLLTSGKLEGQRTPTGWEVNEASVRERAANPTAPTRRQASIPRNHLTVREVAERNDVTVKGVYGWLAKGLLPSTRLPDGTLAIPETAVDNFQRRPPGRPRHNPEGTPQ